MDFAAEMPPTLTPLQGHSHLRERPVTLLDTRNGSDVSLRHSR